MFGFSCCAFVTRGVHEWKFCQKSFAHSRQRVNFSGQSWIHAHCTNWLQYRHTLLDITSSCTRQVQKVANWWSHPRKRRVLFPLQSWTHFHSCSCLQYTAYFVLHWSFVGLRGNLWQIKTTVIDDFDEQAADDSYMCWRSRHILGNLDTSQDSHENIWIPLSVCKLCIRRPCQRSSWYRSSLSFLNTFAHAGHCIAMAIGWGQRIGGQCIGGQRIEKVDWSGTGSEHWVANKNPSFLIWSDRLNWVELGDMTTAWQDCNDQDWKEVFQGIGYLAEEDDQRPWERPFLNCRYLQVYCVVLCKSVKGVPSDLNM